jgi:hypothetical protein
MTMRVVCVEIRSPITGESEDKSPWLQLDREYDVLEVYAHPGGRVDLRLVSEDAGTPALFDSAMFMTVDGRVPSTWEARLEEGGVLRLGPPEWMKPGRPTSIGSRGRWRPSSVRDSARSDRRLGGAARDPGRSQRHSVQTATRLSIPARMAIGGEVNGSCRVLERRQRGACC